MATPNINSNKLNNAIFKRRILTLTKKAKELEILCDVPVTLVCYGTKGELYTWPEDKEECKNAVIQFQRTTRCKKKKVVGTNFLKSKSKILGGGSVKTSNVTMKKSIEIVDEKIEMSINKKELLGVECYLAKKLKDIQEIKFALQTKNELKKNEKDQPMTSEKTLTQDQTKMKSGVYTSCKQITGSDRNLLSNYCSSSSSEEKILPLTEDSCNGIGTVVGIPVNLCNIGSVVGIPVGLNTRYGYGFNNFELGFGFNQQNTMNWGNSNCNITTASYGSEEDYGTNWMWCSTLI